MQRRAHRSSEGEGRKSRELRSVLRDVQAVLVIARVLSAFSVEELSSEGNAELVRHG